MNGLHIFVTKVKYDVNNYTPKYRYAIITISIVDKEKPRFKIKIFNFIFVKNESQP